MAVLDTDRGLLVPVMPLTPTRKALSQIAVDLARSSQERLAHAQDFRPKRMPGRLLPSISNLGGIAGSGSFRRRCKIPPCVLSIAWTHDADLRRNEQERILPSAAAAVDITTTA